MRLRCYIPDGANLNLSGTVHIFRAPPIASGDISEGVVVFTNEDGTQLEPIVIPEGVLVFVDNGDSTWSVE